MSDKTIWDELGYGKDDKKKGLQWVSVCEFCGSVLDAKGKCWNPHCTKDFGD